MPRFRRIAQTSSDQNPRRIRRRYWVAAILFLASAVYLLPSMLAMTPLLQVVIDRSLSDFHGRVQVRTASLGWISPVVLSGITAEDLSGQPLLRAESLTSQKTLLSLIFSKSDYGEFIAQEPVLFLHLRHDGSNLEDSLSKLLTSSEPMAPSSLDLHVSNAIVAMTSDLNPGRWTAERVNGKLAFNRNVPLEVKLGGSLGKDEGRLGRFHLDLQVNPGESDLDFTSGQVRLTARGLPVCFASPLLSRFVEPMTVFGILDGDVVSSWGDGGGVVSLATEKASLSQLHMQAENWIGSDSIRLQETSIHGSLTLSSREIAAEHFVCKADVGEAKFDGVVHWESLAGLLEGQSREIPEVHLEAQLNLAQLAAMLPATLSLKEGLSIDSGLLHMSLNTHDEPGKRRLVLNAESAALHANLNGQPIHWHRPIRLLATAHQSGGESVLESIRCESNFLTLAGSATSTSGEFTAEGDVGATLAELNQFFDLNGLTASGSLSGRFAWDSGGSEDRSPAPQDPLLKAHGQFEVRDAVVNWPGRTAWRQPHVRLAGQAVGQVAGAFVRLDSGNVTLSSGSDQLSANLLQPTILDGKSDLQLQCAVAAQLQPLLAQLKTFLPISVDASGSIDASAKIVASGTHVSARQVQWRLEQLAFTGYGLQISEPQVVGDGELTYDLATGQLNVPSATLASSALAARASRLSLNSNDVLGGLGAEIAFRGDLNRLSSWVKSDQRPAEAVQWFGNAEGNLRVAAEHGNVSGDLSIGIADLTAAKPIAATSSGGVRPISSSRSWNVLLAEKQVSINTKAQLVQASNRLVIDQISLDAKSLQLRAGGELTELNGRLDSQLSGTWQPSWPQLKPLVQAYLGGLLELDGVAGQSFQLSGPLRSPESGSLQAGISPELGFSTQAKWQSGRLLGIGFGPGTCRVSLNQGIVTVSTEPTPYAGGTLRMAPSVNLLADPIALEMPSGEYLSRVQLTPEICRGWLKYVAPLVADATSAQGTFSVRTGGLRVPLNDVYQAEMTGSMTIHEASVGAGPLAQQLILLVDQLRSVARGNVLPTAPRQSTWVTLPEQTVPIAVKQSRVSHQGLNFRVDNVNITTRGQVGFDQTLKLVAQIPVSDEWIGNNPYLAALRGQTLEIPVRGTVSQPRLNTQALEQLSKSMLENAVGNTIQSQLEKLLKDQGNKVDIELLKTFGGALWPRR